MEKREVLRTLGWSDELVDAFLGGFADTPIELTFEELPTSLVVTTSDFRPDGLEKAEANTTGLIVNSANSD